MSANEPFPQIFHSESDLGAGEVRSWASIIEPATIEQASLIARSPIVDGYLALMPDAHVGFGPPVGSVLNTRAGVMPYAVGVDIGCGMIAVETSLERAALGGHEPRILGHIRRLIPSGVGADHGAPLPQAEEFFARNGLPRGVSEASSLADRQGRLAEQTRLLETMRLQFGTLGSGNHFVEVCEDREGAVWLLLHSGSRGIGNKLATAHFQAARAFCAANGLAVEHPESSYVPSGTDEFEGYIEDMLWAQRYAFAQREAMMDQLIEAVGLEIGQFDLRDRINCHHNYAEPLPDGRLRTRKGAIDASPGKMGIIPGSMGAATYIVRGKADLEAYESSPHGAGRLLGRNMARKQLSADEFRAQMAGRTWQDRDATKLLDEAPAAYKPIEQVIADSAELVEPVAILSQFINYKGL